MIVKVLGIMVVLTLSTSVLAAKPSDLRILVRLKKSQSKVHVLGMGLKFQGKQQPIQAVAIPRGESVTIRNMQNAKGNLWQVETEGGDTQQFFGKKLSLRGQQMMVGGQMVPSRLQLISRANKSFDVVAELPLEKYLLGVLPSEMPASWPLEALKVQAVASRSYALSAVRGRKHSHFHVESTIYDQVYDLKSMTSATHSVRAKIRRAVAETQGQYLVAKGDDMIPLRAYYHSDCGGQTEEARHVWGSEAGSSTVKDASCPQSPHGQWERQLSTARLGRAMRRALGLPRTKAQLTTVRVVRRSPSKRALWLAVHFSDGSEHKISSQRFRKALGFRSIKSTNFFVSKTGDRWTVFGKGFGHGVGMCQWGARHLAKRGLDYRQILRHYYAKAEIHTVNY